MGNSADRLMLNGVHLFKRVVQDTRRINGLEAQHFVVEVTDKKRLGCEGVRLDIHIGARDGLEEGRFADIGVATNHQRASVRVNGWQTAKMLSDLFEVDERILEALANRSHATKSSALELLALEQRLSARKSQYWHHDSESIHAPIFQQAHIVAGHGLNQRLGRVQLSQSDPEVIRIVQSVQQITVERVDVGQAGEGLDGLGQALGKSLGCVFDFAGVEGTDSADLEASANLRGKSSLSAKMLAPRRELRCERYVRAGENDVEELLRRRHDGNLFPLSFRHVWRRKRVVVRVRRWSGTVIDQSSKIRPAAPVGQEFAALARKAV
jgi:hypothetical protein